MSSPNIVCVTPTIRPESHAAFVRAWAPLFEKHRVTLVTVWDGDEPRVAVRGPDDDYEGLTAIKEDPRVAPNLDLFCRRTDACRNLGFVAAAELKPDYVLTLDDDVHPTPENHDWDAYDVGWIPPGHDDPIQAHIDALQGRVPLGWMNTAHDGAPYLRGVPYGIRDEAPVMLSHGVWVGTPDFDGETQLRLEKCECGGTGTYMWPSEDGGSPPMVCPDCDGRGRRKLPHSLPYYVGPVPRGVLFPLCGMNVMVRRAALPQLYYAPMGADSGVPDLHRFADIFMGVFLKREFDRLGWACVTGHSTVLHARASDARKNFEQEKTGRVWMERLGRWEHPVYCPDPPDMWAYFNTYRDKRRRYANLIEGLLRN